MNRPYENTFVSFVWPFLENRMMDAPEDPHPVPLSRGGEGQESWRRLGATNPLGPSDG